VCCEGFVVIDSLASGLGVGKLGGSKVHGTSSPKWGGVGVQKGPMECSARKVDLLKSVGNQGCAGVMVQPGSKKKARLGGGGGKSHI